MQHRSTQQIDRDGRQRGVSMLEVSIVSVMSVASLGVFYGAANHVGEMTVVANQESKRRARQIDVLDAIASELRSTGKTGQFEINDTHDRITYQKLVGASQSGADVSGVWSPTYMIQLTARGEVVRRERGKTVSWGGGVEELWFHYNKGRKCIVVSCMTEQRGKLVKRRIYVYPQN